MLRDRVVYGSAPLPMTELLGVLWSDGCEPSEHFYRVVQASGINIK